MPIQDKAQARRIHSFNGFLGRWRRNASHAGLVAVVLTVLAAAAALFALCACQSIVGSGQSFPPAPR
jgi:hypothetical protein